MLIGRVSDMCARVDWGLSEQVCMSVDSDTGSGDPHQCDEIFHTAVNFIHIWKSQNDGWKCNITNNFATQF